jgi:hypothetical protein
VVLFLTLVLRLECALLTLGAWLHVILCLREQVRIEVRVLFLLQLEIVFNLVQLKELVLLEQVRQTGSVSLPRVVFSQHIVDDPECVLLLLVQLAL